MCQSVESPFVFDPDELAYLEAARVARLSTADADGRPQVVPVCFAFRDDAIVTPIDEKPKAVGPTELARTRHIEANPHVALVADHYTQDWDRLGWVQIRGTAATAAPDADGHAAGIAALRDKYTQYESHDLEHRPIIVIDPARVKSWGSLDPSASRAFY